MTTLSFQTKPFNCPAGAIATCPRCGTRSAGEAAWSDFWKFHQMDFSFTLTRRIKRGSLWRHLHCSYRSRCYCSWHSCVCFLRTTRSRIRCDLDNLNLNAICTDLSSQIIIFITKYITWKIWCQIWTNRVKQVSTWVSWPGCVAFIARPTAELVGSLTPTNWNAKASFMSEEQIW